MSKEIDMLEWLNGMYVDDLNRIVEYNGSKKPRFRHANVYAGMPRVNGVDVTKERIWVWSDLHFGHKNIIRFSDRPFDDIPHMDEMLIANFNECVRPEDVSIWVGDVSFYGPEKTNEILRRCNGYKILVVGNHDIVKRKVKQMDFDEVHALYHLPHSDVDLVFTHFPMYNLPMPWINVHGHLHINHRIDSVQHINVCCEFHDYRPLELEQIQKWARMRIVEYSL